MKTIKKHRAKLIFTLLMICLLSCALPQSALADSARLKFSAKTSGSGNKIKVKRVTYDKDTDYVDWNYGRPAEIEVDFSSRVTWKRGAKVTVKDNKGKTYHAFLTDKDSDECDINIFKLKEGRTYTITINGIKRRGTTGYRKLTIKVTVPAPKPKSQKVKVKKIEIDDEDNEIEISFASKVDWKRNAKISSIKDNTGKTCKGYLIDIDDDECEIYIPNMKYGRTYTIQLSGIRARGASSYGTVTIKVSVPSWSQLS